MTIKNIILDVGGILFAKEKNVLAAQQEGMESGVFHSIEDIKKYLVYRA